MLVRRFNCRLAAFSGRLPVASRAFVDARRSLAYAATSSVVEESLGPASNFSQTNLPTGVSLSTGEMLLYKAGGASRRTLMGYWIGSGVMWVYLATTNGLALLYPASEMPTSWSNWLMKLVTGGAILSTLLSSAATRATIRCAVLTADGHHVRLYPYGTFFGLVCFLPSPLESQCFFS